MAEQQTSLTPPDSSSARRTLGQADGLDLPATLQDITDDDTQELPTVTPEPGSWGKLIERERQRAA